MMIRLPKDPENWTPHHADKCIEHALKLFDRYEKKLDLDMSKEEIDDLYRPYQLACQQAVEVASYTNWRKAEAELLP
jgi:hypothetical protein